MDVLTDVLDSLHVRNTMLGRLELTAPWGLRVAEDQASFLVVTRGTCWLEVDGVKDAIQLAGGDYVLLPHGQPHVLRDHRGTPVAPIEEVLSQCPSQRSCQPGGIFRYGGGGQLTVLLGGCFSFEHGEHNPLIAALPPVVHVRGDQGAPVHWLEASLQFIASEMASGQPGAETVVSRLIDILLVQAVRAHVAQIGDGAKGWLRALIDPQVGAALSLIHEKPESTWTVDSLASAVGMSRSGFAARFTQLMEEPPLTYLTRWRMHKASRLLRSSVSGIGAVAGQVGYDTEAAFSKAFKRWTGSSPGAYRRTRAVLHPPAA